MVYVDELQVWPAARGLFAKGSCHLTADTVEELHKFAADIGLKRSWFQAHPTHPHYDLTPARRQVAIIRGATFVPAKVQARPAAASRGCMNKQQVEEKLVDIERQLTRMYEEDSEPVHNLETIVRDLIAVVRALNESR